MRDEDDDGGLGAFEGVDPVEVDRLLADELNQLSFNDRERVMEEVHGVVFVTVLSNSGGHRLDDALVWLQEELNKHYYHNHPDCSANVTNKTTTANNNHKSMPFNIQHDGNCSSNRTSRTSTSTIPPLNHNDVQSSPFMHTAYREARSKNSELLLDIKFQRSFLIAEGFDPKKAALRLMNYLDFIRDLYGTSEVLFRPIFMDDLHTLAKEQLAMGAYQLLPDRDSSGRRIFIYLRDICSSSVSLRHRSQVFMYLVQRLAEDTNGMVAVAFLHNSSLFSEGFNAANDSRELIDCYPSRFSAIHLCFPNRPFYNVVKSAVMLIMGKENRSRVRIHIGSLTECHYSLRSFGIPVNHLPIALELNTTHRKDNITDHTKWLCMQKAIEMAIQTIDADYQDPSDFARSLPHELHHELCNKGNGDNDDHGGGDNIEQITTTTSNNDMNIVGMKAVNIVRVQFIECPRHEDCLFGRGRNIMKHPGNVAMRRLLDEKRERYSVALHHRKAQIAWEVVNEIKNGSGRFLKESSTGLYTLVDDETARKKISIAFRDSKNKGQQKRIQGIQQQRDVPTSNDSVVAPNTATSADLQEFTKRQKVSHAYDGIHSPPTSIGCFQAWF